MRHGFNFDQLSALSLEEKRTQVFTAIKGALAMLPIALDVMGQQTALKMAANDPRLIAGGGDMPSEDAFKNFLVSDRAAKHFGGQKWAVASDSPGVVQTASRAIQFVRDNIGELDLGYTPLFKFIDMRNATTDTVDVARSTNAVVFEETPRGGQIKVNRKLASDVTSLKMLTYTGGVAILDDWLRFNKWYQVEQAVEDMQLGYAREQAELHFGLITAVGAGSNVAFDTDLATTFNKAVAGMVRKLDAKGYVLGSNPQVDIVVSPEHVGAVMAMLEARKGSPIVAFGTQKQPIAFGVRNVIVTTKIGAAENSFYVVVPERKLVRAVWADLTIEASRKADYRANDWYGHGQFNSLLGDQDQVARVALS